MTRRGKRRLSIAIVASIVGVTSLAAHGDPMFAIRPAGGSSRNAPPNTHQSLVFSIRNHTGGPKTITLTNPNTGACTLQTIRRMDGTTPGNQASLVNFQQAQFVIEAPTGYPLGIHSCQWTVSSSGINEFFNANFQVSQSTVAIDPQPGQLTIGSPMVLSAEPQELLVQNYTTTQRNLQVVIMGSGGLTFDGACTGASCAITVRPTNNPPNFVTVPVKCQTPGGLAEMGLIKYMDGGMEVASHGYTCHTKGGFVNDPIITITEDPIDLRGPAMTTAMGTANVTGSDNSLVNATITGQDATSFWFTTSACNTTMSQQCNPNPPLPLATQLQIACIPSNQFRTATLTVNGQPLSTDTATLTCALNTPSLVVETSLVDVGNVDVGDMATGSVFLRNGGTGMLTGVVIDTTDSAWTHAMCTTANPCSINSNVTIQVPLTFSPTVHGLSNPTATISSSNGGADTTELEGLALGSRLRMVSPSAAPWVVDLGTLSLDELRTKEVKMFADGNVPLNVTLGSVPAPFSVMPSAVGLMPMMEGTFDVRCQSAMPLDTQTQDLAVNAGPGSYMNDTPQLQIKCKVANTRVRVMPSELDFGEVIKGSGGVPITITITNPGMDVMLESVKLSVQRPELSLTPPVAAQLLPMGGQVMTTLVLSTANTVTIDQVALEVKVQNAEPLVIPITGKVVTASATVSPSELDLGTVCVGTPVNGTITMTNTGTATLRLQPPTMEAPFAPLFINPTTYPSDMSGVPLFEGKTAEAGVLASGVGKVESTLGWDVNVPTGATGTVLGSPFSVPVSVEFIETGTGVSPKRIVFDSIDANTTSPQRTITLENCDEKIVVVRIVGIDPSKGDANAWELTPSEGLQDLEPHKTLRLVARFAPKKPGLHQARIHVQVDGADKFVDLEGLALGDVDERKSLYGCDCNSSGSPGWLLLLLLVLRRRR